MKRLFYILLWSLLPVFSFSQELLAEVVVNYSKVQGSNTQVFKTLEKSLKDFINNTSWTNQPPLALQERIRCSFSILIDERPSTDKFKGSILIQSSRPVYNSTYSTPVLNFQDNHFSFDYIEFEPLIFNDRKFSGKNLIDVISFYVYMVLGYDADTFSQRGGTEYFTIAQKVANNAVNQGFNGWNSFDGPKTRGGLIADLISDQSNTLRGITYQYHRLGLDNMPSNELQAKNVIASNLMKLNSYSGNYLFFPLDIFLTAKKEEIKNIFSGGQPATSVNVSDLKALLQTINPINSTEYWDKIKN
ncbi:DUF4835 family protein [Apibacter sp. HY039]|uniref:type IX secretion system protein PorD n=1 Tax=Apibacter sp. HY039 TaxID=2501476 RepID=UPI000FEC18EF|nr:DUF4835 family protein [Apibacter sp. HY039]